ncbi:Ribosomal protein S6--L-glutamate ligase [Thalassocella blandensis]|nr:Ribosomal protein S6--L-glutamate ligase [Thalassocella blandensis]
MDAKGEITIIPLSCFLCFFMKLISFDTLRTLHFPLHIQLKPDQIFKYKEQLLDADWVLYPEYWQLNALLFAFKARIFPSVATYMIGHNKVEMTRAFEAVVPANLPVTRIHGNTAEKAELLWDTFATPFVAKIPKSSMGEGVFLIESRRDWQAYCEKTDTLYVQEFLPIDRDLRLVVVGEKVVSAYWRLQSSNGFHNNVARGGVVALGDIPPDAIVLVEYVAKTLGIDHAGFDVAMVDGFPYLLEFNRMFGTRGIDGKFIARCVTEYLSDRMDYFDPEFPGFPSGRLPKKNRRVA